MIVSVKTRVSSIGVLAAIAILAVVVSGVCAGSNAWAACAGSHVTIKNQNSFPIWLGEEVSGPTNIVLPDTNDWEIPAAGQATFCLPTVWISGAFWPRTECNFSGTFGNDPDYKSCTSASECTLQNPSDPNHICYGGKCVINCGASPGTSGDCSSLSGSVCVANTFCGFAGGVCKTGDCGSGVYQCEGAWDSLTAQYGPAPPVSLFEITDQASAPNYDVSHVSGYNVSVVVTPPAAQAGGNCQPSGCVSDLNTSLSIRPAGYRVAWSLGTHPVRRRHILSERCLRQRQHLCDWLQRSRRSVQRFQPRGPALQRADSQPPAYRGLSIQRRDAPADSGRGDLFRHVRSHQQKRYGEPQRYR